MKNNIKFIYFDVGGVMFKFKNGLEKISINYNVDLKKVEEVFKKYDDEVCRGKIDTNQLWLNYKKELGIKSEDDFNFSDFWVSNFEPIKSIHKLIFEIKQEYNIGLLTNIYKETFNKSIKNGSIPNINYFAVIQSCDLGYVKPEYEIYKIAQDLTGVISEEILFVDDNIKFLVPAKNMGWQTFLYDSFNHEKSSEELMKLIK